MPPATHTAKATPKPQPNAISSQSPLAWKATSVRSERFSAATDMATDPVPKAMMIRVPRNSDTHSPTGP